ncbi:MAG: hypothetical protein ABI790_15640, partial [Betaproteobacteria bacterium]
MKTSILYVARIAFAWTLTFVLALIIWLALRGDRSGGPPWPIVLSVLLFIGWQVNRAISHLRR